MRLLPALLAASVLATALAAAASAAEAPPRAVIEDTYVIAPRLANGYQLVETVNYADKGNPAAGVGLRYRDVALPLRADLFVYPGGESETPEHAESEFRASVAYAQQRGAYSDVRWGKAEDIDLALPDDTHWRGRVISMQLRLDGTQYVSRTYLFHRGVYDYKLRADLPVDLADRLSTESDGLLRAVLGRLQVVSTGSCGRQMEINVLKAGEATPASYVDGVSADGWSLAINESEVKATDGKAATESPLVRRSLIAAQRQIKAGCTVFPFQPQADDDATIVKLHYPAGFWQSTPRQ